MSTVLFPISADVTVISKMLLIGPHVTERL